MPIQNLTIISSLLLLFTISTTKISITNKYIVPNSSIALNDKFVEWKNERRQKPAKIKKGLFNPVSCGNLLAFTKSINHNKNKNKIITRVRYSNRNEIFLFLKMSFFIANAIKIISITVPIAPSTLCNTPSMPRMLKAIKKDKNRKIVSNKANFNCVASFYFNYSRISIYRKMN